MTSEKKVGKRRSRPKMCAAAISHLNFWGFLLILLHFNGVNCDQDTIVTDCILYACSKNPDEPEPSCKEFLSVNTTGLVCKPAKMDSDSLDQRSLAMLQALDSKVKTLDVQVRELSRSIKLAPSSDSSTAPDESEGQDVPHHDVNLTTSVNSCVSLVQQGKKKAAMRYWRSIEDFFLDQNNIQVSYRYLKRIIKASYNGQRHQVLPTLHFINQLERTSQKLAAFTILLDSMEENGHFPGKEIFTVAYFAGRTFDPESKIWSRFPTPVSLLSTLWRLNWFVKHENESYPLHFADPINSPLEILTPKRSEFMESSPAAENQEHSVEQYLDWHFISTRTWHWLKIIGASGYVKVDPETMLLVRDSREREPGEFELHLNENLQTFQIFHNQSAVRIRLAFGKPFAFTVQNNNGGEPPAEFYVEESKTAPNSRIIELFD